MEPHAVGKLVRDGALVRIRQGVYADMESWRAADPAERYRQFVRATVWQGRRTALASAVSAAAMHRLPIIGTWPAVVHTLDPRATGGSNARAVVRHRAGPPAEPVQIEGVPVTSLSRTLIDVASSSSFLVAVTMIDHALRAEQERVRNDERRGVAGAPALTKADLFAELEYVRPRTGYRQAERAIAFANPLAANPGESLSRVRMHELGFEVPELQVAFPDIGGRDYWVDCYWRRIRMIGEFDGKLKYTRGAVLGDRDPAEVVVAEKVREDALRRHVSSFIRWDWDTAISPRRFYDFLVDSGVPRA